MALQTYFPVITFVREVQKILQDSTADGTIYDVQTEILPELNNGCAATVAADPQALVFNVPFLLVPATVGIVATGSNYAQGDTIILAGGTYTTPMTILVSGEESGAITQVQVQDYGSYTAYPTTATQASTSGSGSSATFKILPIGPRQELTPDGASLIDIRYNLGTDGQTITNVITKVPKDSMDADLPTWPMDVCGVGGKPATIQHYITDPDDPKRWYPWPHPNTMATPWYVQIVYRSVPNDVGLYDSFPLPSLYWPAVKAWIIAHVLQRRDDMRNDAGVQKIIADKMAEFNAQLGLTAVATKTTVPRDRIKP